MAGIFISYRRDDSGGWAGRLSDRLAEHFGPEQVFIDVDGIAPGQDFGEVIADRLSDIDSVLVVIGPKWLTIADEDAVRRLDIPDDFVRSEVAAALASDALVVPVLVDDAKMPKRDDLPGVISELASRNALEVSATRFGDDSARLIKALEAETKELSLLARLTSSFSPGVWVGILVGLVLAAVALTALATRSGGSELAFPTSTIAGSATSAQPAAAMSPTTSTTSTTQAVVAAVTPEDLIGIAVFSGYEFGFAEYAIPLDPGELTAPTGGCEELADWATGLEGIPTSPDDSGPIEIDVVLQGKNLLSELGTAVSLNGLTIDVVSWEPPMEGSRVSCLRLPPTDGPAPLVVGVTLPSQDGALPDVSYTKDLVELDDFPRVLVTGGETQFIDMWVDATGCRCEWTATLHAVVDGSRVDFPIAIDGQPFIFSGGSGAVPLSLSEQGLSSP